MLRAAVDAAAEVGSERPLVLAVTVLTSLDNSDLDSIGIKSKTIDQVALLARLAEENGLDGVVCSPQEISVLRKVCHPDFLLMVPGVRPVWAASGDQKRTMTPNEAFNHGADYLVIGRPITENKNPVKALELIVQELV